jgi:hypothetical protein
MGLHFNDVVEPGDRPIGAELALGAVVDRILAAQPLEEGQNVFVTNRSCRLTSILSSGVE